MAQTVKNLPAMQKTWVCSLGQEDLLEKEMATHSSILSWRIPWTEEPGGLKSMGLQSRIRLSDCHFFFHIHYCCSVTRSCLTLCVPMDCSTPGFPVLHYLYVHWVGDAIQPSHPLSHPFPPCPQSFPASGSLNKTAIYCDRIAERFPEGSP